MNLLSVPRLLLLPAFFFATSLTWSTSPAPADPPPEDEEVFSLSPFTVSGSALGYVSGLAMGATVGGAQDIRYFRSEIEAGRLPHPNTLTAEGLFSEHDLPLVSAVPCERLFCVAGEATETSIAGADDVRFLAQLGLHSGLDFDSWERAPLNLIAVVDKSGSMNGPPIALVRQALRHALDHLRHGDQIGIVVFDDAARTLLEPVMVNNRTRPKILAAIEKIHAGGMTNMIGGMELGYEMARVGRDHFDGQTRLMLFADERPNVGDTDAGSFMGLAYAGSREGIGLTMIGVSVQFGAELATQISAVRGCNLFYFANQDEVQKLFGEEFDTIVTELAYDLQVTVTPAPGLRVTSVYGVPGNLLEWVDERSIRLSVGTVFLSLRKGGIYFGFGNELNDLPPVVLQSAESVGRIELSYTDVVSGNRLADSADFPLVELKEAGTGLARGRLLVNQYVALKTAAIAHYQRNDQMAAYRAVNAAARLFRESTDFAMAKERVLIEKAEAHLALLAGVGGEVAPERAGGQRAASDLIPREILGVWRVLEAPDDKDFLDVGWGVAFWPSGELSIFAIFEEKDRLYHELRFIRKGGSRFEWAYDAGDESEGEVVATGRYRLRNDTLTLNVNGVGRVKLGRDVLRFVSEPIASDPVSGLPER